MAEDYAPFNLNVTTQDPGSESLRKFGTGDDRWGIRVAFTSNLNLLTGKAIINAGGGGTAYYNSFNWSTDDVALVFNRGEYTAANTASHEVGHTLNLTHDGAGTTTEYYGAHGWVTTKTSPSGARVSTPAPTTPRTTWPSSPEATASATPPMTTAAASPRPRPFPD